MLDQPALDICRNGEDAYRVTLHRPSGDSEEEVLFESREIVGWVDDKQVGTEQRGRSGAPQEQM